MIFSGLMDRISLKNKIIGGILFLVVLVAVFVYGYFPRRQKIHAMKARSEEIRLLAKVLSQSISTGLEFGDLESVRNAVAGVRSRDDLISLKVFNAEGGLFFMMTGTEGNDGETGETAAKADREKERLDAGEAVLSSGEEIGKLVMAFSLDGLNRQAAANRTAVLFVSLVIIGAGWIFGLYLSRLVLHPLARVNAIIQTVAQGSGDLTRRIKVDSSDEIGVFAGGFNDFLDKLADLVCRVQSATDKVASAAEHIVTTSQQLASGSEEQAGQTGEMATSIHQMTSAIIQNSKNAAETVGIVKNAGDKALEGTEAMKTTHQGMDEIVETTTRTGAFIQSLSSSAEQIGEIVGLIIEIADQTNLLALNAAIEAARAGEWGRGFAVVADEVRKLADRTTKATEQIVERIKVIQNETREASQAMSEARKVVRKGKEAAVVTEQVLGGIMEAVHQAIRMVEQIASATEEMGSGAEEISKNVEAISTVTRESSRSSEEMAGTADQLKKQTEILRHLVGQFKTNGDSEWREIGHADRAGARPSAARQRVKKTVPVI